MDIKDGDLVMLRLRQEDDNNIQFAYNTWFRVMFIDNDGTFIGKCERVEWPYFTRYEIGQDVRLDIDKVLSIYQGGEWCYSDKVTVCNCPGLCRNK